MVSILLDLRAQHATGVLRVLGGTVCPMISFVDGRPVFAEGGRHADDFGAVLHDEGWLTRAQAQLVLSHIREGLRRGTSIQFGAAAIELGFLTPHEVHEGLRAQVQRTILDCFRVEVSHLTFESFGAFPEGTPRIEVGIEGLIVAGVRASFDDLRVGELLAPHLERYPTLGDAPAIVVKRLEIRGEDHRLLRRLDGYTTVAELMVSDRELPALLAALIALNEVESNDFPRQTPTPQAAPRFVAVEERSEPAMQATAAQHGAQAGGEPAFEGADTTAPEPEPEPEPVASVVAPAAGPPRSSTPPASGPSTPTVPNTPRARPRLNNGVDALAGSLPASEPHPERLEGSAHPISRSSPRPQARRRRPMRSERAPAALKCPNLHVCTPRAPWRYTTPVRMGSTTNAPLKPSNRAAVRSPTIRRRCSPGPNAILPTAPLPRRSAISKRYDKALRHLAIAVRGDPANLDAQRYQRLLTTRLERKGRNRR